MDVALAPLEPNEFNDSKSEIKVAECGRYKVPLVASDVGSYDEWIINGVTGYLIDPTKGRTEWIRTLTKIGKDKKHREEMGENLFKITEENFDMNKVVGQRLQLYKDLVGVSESVSQVN
jgi:glycosyltransferase involved in cell wall biosynthesis